jgi:glycosyltransferase involved in cell wall biosynthesis
VRVGLDGKCLLPPRAGVARYLEGLLHGCSVVPHDDVSIDVLEPSRPVPTLPWVLWGLQRASARGYGALHLPFYYPPLAPRCPAVVAIHDVLVLEHPQWFPRGRLNTLRRMIPAGARRAAAIVTGSPAIAAAIAALCDVPPSRIHVIAYGLDRERFAVPDPHAVADARAAYRLEKPFVMQLGALEPRRGVDLALTAMAELRERHPDLELALAGEQRSRVTALEHPPPWVRKLGRVGDEHLPGLLAGASAVVAPSRGEGFDFPVLEALACGAAVVASDIPVHVEQFAPAVALFESGEAGALAAALAGVLADSSRAAALRAAGPRHAASFSWERSARAHLDLWREVGR